MQIFIGKDGEQFGPFTQEQCVEALAHGHLSNTDLAWYEGLDRWYPLHAVLGMKVVYTPSSSDHEPTLQVYQYSDPRSTACIAG